MDWLKEAIKNYDKLSESEQAHVDAALDSMDDDNNCMCGKEIDSCPLGEGDDRFSLQI